MAHLTFHNPAILRLATDISASHLRELQRFAEVGRISAGLIHDMASPLTAAILHLEQEEPKALSSVRHARRSIRVLERYIEAARQQLRQHDSARLFVVHDEVEQVKHILLPQARQRRVRLHFYTYTGCTLRGDPVKFQRILTNLITNAIEACQGFNGLGRPLVRITLSRRRERLIIRVRDWGPGVSPEQLSRIFEPFYTTKKPGRSTNTGLGLYNVRSYVRNDFDGKITAINPPGRGTEFRVELPLRPL